MIVNILHLKFTTFPENIWNITVKLPYSKNSVLKKGGLCHLSGINLQFPLDICLTEEFPISKFVTFLL